MRSRCLVRLGPGKKQWKYFDGLKGDLPDEELAAIKQYVEKRSHEAAQVTVTPVSTAKHCISARSIPRYRQTCM